MEARENGRFGEEKGAEYLRKKGYRIVERNFRCRLGEIDIIAENAEYLVVAEVKTRKNALYGQACEYVTYSKQQKIKRAAMYYLSSHESDKQPRFDVIEVYIPDGLLGRVRINHIEDAFI